MDPLTKLSFIFVCFSVIFIKGSAKTSCRDHVNKNVDWFIMYKLPEDADSPHELVREGHGYFYMDVNNPQWQLGKVALNETKQALYYTMQQAYDNMKSEDQAVLFYNDETPEKNVTEHYGHTKGVVSFNMEGGYWLVHSLPRFPEIRSYYWPPSGRMYGQTFLCMSLPYSELDVIGKQFLYSFPWLWHVHFPEKFQSDNPNMAMAIKSKKVDNPPWNNMVELKTERGQQFLSFAKYSKFDADIYDALLAPYFKSIMFTETWQNGKGKTHSNCSTKYEVENVEKIHIGDVEFSQTRDHSKWGITKDKQWVCIGGINRMDAQKKRAGGMVCSDIPNVWRAFNQSISTIEKCSSKKSSGSKLSEVNLLQLN